MSVQRSPFGPTLETQRLVLRPPAAEDFEAWAAFHADPVAARFIGGAQSREQCWRSFRTMAGAWALDGFAMFSVIEKASGRWIGRIGPWAPLGWPGLEVGWGLAQEAQGQGYAREAARASIDWAFDVLGWEDVVHCIDPANHASRKVAQALGSANRGPGRLPPPFQDSVIDIWGQTRAHWRARAPAAPGT
jgi:RimJ/RimL family protein N-acetyltransferase